MALVSLLLLAVLLPTSCYTASVNVGIVNGKEAEPHSRPYMVSVQYRGQHICGGFLVTSSLNFVMTAAHCQDNITNWKDVTAVIGAHNLSDNNFERIAVKQKYSHPEFPRTSPENDIMLLKLERSAANSKYAHWIPIPDSANELISGCTIAGWGRKTTKGNKSNVLMEANVSIQKPDTCKAHWPFFKNSAMLCGGGYKHGFCQGDSGGPLVCKGVAVGIISFQEADCDHPAKPNVYTRISGFLPWITEKINGTK